MKIKSINLPSAERFACSKADIKNIFSETLLSYAAFGSPKTFTFEGLSKRPKLTGKVIARLTISTLRDSRLSLYPIRSDYYDDEAAIDFKENILPQMKIWLDSIYQSAAILKRWDFIVEWSPGTHRVHKGNYS